MSKTEKKVEKNDEGAVETKTASKSSSVIVWLKQKTYIDDAKRVDAGVYLLSELPKRWEVLKADTIEVFEKEIPSRKLAVIARALGVNPDGVEDDKLIEMIVKPELKAY